MLDFLEEMSNQYHGIVLAFFVFIFSLFFSAISYVKRNIQYIKESSIRMNLFEIVINSLISAVFGVVLLQILEEYYPHFSDLTKATFAIFGSGFLHIFVLFIYVKLGIKNEK